MNQRGFLSITMIAAIAAGVIIAGLTIALKVQSDRLDGEQEAHGRTKAAYAGFVAETKRIGEEAQKKATAEIERQKQVTKERTASYEKRLASINAAYRSLRGQRADSGGSPVPAVPTGTITVDDASSRDRLLEVLYHADRNTSQLIELQDWLRAQGKVAQ